ncbi:UNVERIFIED_CONTAM: hypothetical protein NCL1_35366 [Trichonephila clavipes]
MGTYSIMRCTTFGLQNSNNLLWHGCHNHVFVIPGKENNSGEYKRNENLMISWDRNPTWTALNRAVNWSQFCFTKWDSSNVLFL